MACNEYILCIDDDPLIARILERITACSLIAFSTAEGFHSQAQRYRPTAVFLDIHIAETCGIELIPKMRQLWPHAPVLIITSDTSSNWIGRALAAGAQDFLLKPLQPEEVKARLQVRLDEARLSAEMWVMDIGNTHFDRRNCILSCSEKRIFISPLEARILEVLANNLHRICPRDIISEAAWPGLAVSNNALEQRVASLRKSFRFLGSNTYIRSLRNQGYIFEITAASEGKR